MLTIAQAAERLQVSRDTVRRILPELRAVDLRHGQGRRMIRIPEDGLQAYLAGGRIIRPAMDRTSKQEFDPELWEAPGRLKRRRSNGRGK